MTEESSEPTTGASADPLGGARTVSGYLREGAIVAPVAGSLVTAEFGPEGRLSGSAGCNRYVASYSTDGTSLEISGAASTRMFCTEPEGVMEQETAYLALLQTVAALGVGSMLELVDGDGAVLVRYERTAV